MYYHSATLLLFRPFMRLRFLESAFSPLGICVQSAENVSSLMRSYRQLYSPRRASSFMPYLILMSSVNHLVQFGPRINSNYIVQNFNDLADMSIHHRFASRSLDILRFFAYHWNISLPSPFTITIINPIELCSPSNSSLNLFCPRLTSASRAIEDTMDSRVFVSKKQAHLFLPFPHQGAPLLYDEAFDSGADSGQSKESQLKLDGFDIIDPQTTRVTHCGVF